MLFQLLKSDIGISDDFSQNYKSRCLHPKLCKFCIILSYWFYFHFFFLMFSLIYFVSDLNIKLFVLVGTQEVTFFLFIFVVAFGVNYCHFYR